MPKRFKLPPLASNSLALAAKVYGWKPGPRESGRADQKHSQPKRVKLPALTPTVPQPSRPKVSKLTTSTPVTLPPIAPTSRRLSCAERPPTPYRPRGGGGSGQFYEPQRSCTPVSSPCMDDLLGEAFPPDGPSDSSSTSLMSPTPGGSISPFLRNFPSRDSSSQRKRPMSSLMTGYPTPTRAAQPRAGYPTHTRATPRAAIRQQSLPTLPDDILDTPPQSRLEGMVGSASPFYRPSCLPRKIVRFSSLNQIRSYSDEESPRYMDAILDQDATMKEE